MTTRRATLLGTLTLTALTITAFALSSPSSHEPSRVHATPSPTGSATPPANSTPPPNASPDLSGLVNLADTIHTQEALHAYLDALQQAADVQAANEAQAAAEAATRQHSAPPAPSASTSYGTPSAAHWAAIAQCESGTTNGWRTGYFGIESGNEGQYSYEQQIEHADAIYRQYGPAAWGCKTDIP